MENSTKQKFYDQLASSEGFDLTRQELDVHSFSRILSQISEQKVVDKKQSIPGEKNLIWVLSGMLKVVETRDKDSATVSEFLGEGEVYVPAKVPGYRTTIQTVVSSEVLLIDNESLLKKVQVVPAFTKFYFDLMFVKLGALKTDLVDTLSLKGAERFQVLASKRPEVISAGRKIDLASHIGVTPVQLSRIWADFKKTN